jgi:hypothetical protein
MNEQFPEHEMAKPRKIIELRDKNNRVTQTPGVCVVVCKRWIGEGGCVKSGKLHV